MCTQVTSKANLVHDLAEQIGKKLAEAELKGAEGQVSADLTTFTLKINRALNLYQLMNRTFRCCRKYNKNLSVSYPGKQCF
jgi:hypothetical protein